MKKKKELQELKITMPPNATKVEVRKYMKTFESIVKTFAKLTGEKPYFKWREIK